MIWATTPFIHTITYINIRQNFICISSVQCTASRSARRPVHPQSSWSTRHPTHIPPSCSASRSVRRPHSNPNPAGRRVSATTAATSRGAGKLKKGCEPSAKPNNNEPVAKPSSRVPITHSNQRRPTSNERQVGKSSQHLSAADQNRRVHCRSAKTKRPTRATDQHLIETNMSWEII